MAMRQQQQIDTQQQMLAAKEQRLRFLKTQESRAAVTVAETERLHRLRERVEAQESKLRRLRALRGQVDLQKTYNVTLGNDLDSIRALFSEKEKELTLAVAKVEALTRQLEDLRRNRRGGLGSHGFIAQNSPNGVVSPAAKELEKLRLELQYRNQLSLQQNARLNMQREVLQQRQMELHSVDKRIVELQSRIHKKRNLNVQNYKVQGSKEDPIDHQNNNPSAATSNVTLHMRSASTNTISPSVRSLSRGNIVAVEPFSHVPTKSLLGSASYASSQAAMPVPNDTLFQNSMTQTVFDKPDPIKHQNQPVQHLRHQQQKSQQQHKYQPQQQLHHPVQQQSSNQKESIFESDTSEDNMLLGAESDEKKLAARQQKQSQIRLDQYDLYRPCYQDTINTTTPLHQDKGVEIQSLMSKVTSREFELLVQSQDYENEHNNCEAIDVDTTTAGKMGNFRELDKAQHYQFASENVKSTSVLTTSGCNSTDENTTDKIGTKQPYHFHQNIPLGNLVVPPRKPVNSVAPTLAMNFMTGSTSNGNDSTSGKPSDGVRRNASGQGQLIFNDVQTASMASRPALPPKPVKSTNIGVLSKSVSNHANEESDSECTGINTAQPAIDSKTDDVSCDVTDISLVSSKLAPVHNKQPIKAKPLTIKKHPFLEQPKLKSLANFSASNNSNSTGVRKSSSPSFTVNSTQQQQSNKWNEAPGTVASGNAEKLFEENENSNDRQNNDNMIDKSAHSFERHKKLKGSGTATEDGVNVVARRKRNFVSLLDSNEANDEPTETNDSGPETGDNALASSTGFRQKLSRRVSFDPLALLLDASLEGELELVEKTAMQVTNPSAANDEGITALHNAICAGHFEIVKFLVNFGCDVNAQDSDGWTPLHCAASCNNLPMVKFLVESGACLFAATLSDHETPAEKCEEDEEGFDGCSEYLYSIQEKLGILNNGEVYAVFAYESQQPDELSFFVNDKLTILRKGDEAEREWWWARDITAKEGYVPRNLLGLHPRLTP
uniref:Putative apoptosis-stimulating of p53 protein 2 isoform x2 n=1 Tax=Anopheles marajoara TaxID=58244 RepID=A0A2M4BC25_9DIPT